MRSEGQKVGFSEAGGRLEEVCMQKQQVGGFFGGCFLFFSFCGCFGGFWKVSLEGFQFSWNLMVFPCLTTIIGHFYSFLFVNCVCVCVFFPSEAVLDRVLYWVWGFKISHPQNKFSVFSG